MYKDYHKLYLWCAKVNFSPQNVGIAKRRWDKLTVKFFSHFTKEEIVSAMQDLWTNLNSEMGFNSQEDQWNSFVSYLDYCSDRMNINRWCRLQLLLGNARSHQKGVGANEIT